MSPKFNSIIHAPGIYCITCLANGKIYIGSAINIRNRCLKHCSDLRNKTHRNSHLQRAWDKYGEDVFCFDVIEECDKSVLLKREQHYLDTIQPFDEKGFNIGRVAGAAVAGRPLSQEHRDKLSVALKGRKPHPNTIAANTGRPRSPETRAKIGAAQKGRKRSPEQIARMSESKLGKKRTPHTPETRAKMSAAHSGVKLSPEHCASISKVQKGRKQTPEFVERRTSTMKKRFIVITPDGVEIEILGLGKFCRENGLLQHCMSEVANGKVGSHRGWKCRHAEE